jgi:hypothetical protein
MMPMRRLGCEFLLAQLAKPAVDSKKLRTNRADLFPSVDDSGTFFTIVQRLAPRGRTLNAGTGQL